MIAFFEALGDLRFRSTDHARGPWDPGALHGGPVVALLARCLARVPTGPPMRIVRVAASFPRPVPHGELEVSLRDVRAGRSVHEVEVTARAGGREVCVARCLRIRTEPVAAASDVPTERPPRGIDACDPFAFPIVMAEPAYHTAMDVRLAAGTFGTGRVVAWLRMRGELVAGEAPAPLERVLVAADAGSGISAVLDWRRFVFVNPDLDVAVHRDLRGDAVCLDARTDVGPDGVGLASSVVRDADGQLGVARQTLIIQAR